MIRRRKHETHRRIDTQNSPRISVHQSIQCIGKVCRCIWIARRKMRW